MFDEKREIWKRNLRIFGIGALLEVVALVLLQANIQGASDNPTPPTTIELALGYVQMPGAFVGALLLRATGGGIGFVVAAVTAFAIQSALFALPIWIVVYFVDRLHD